MFGKQKKCLTCQNPIISLSNSRFCSENCKEKYKSHFQTFLKQNTPNETIQKIQTEKNSSKNSIQALEDNIILTTIKKLATQKTQKTNKTPKNKAQSNAVSTIIFIIIAFNIISAIIAAIAGDF